MVRIVVLGSIKGPAFFSSFSRCTPRSRPLKLTSVASHRICKYKWETGWERKGGWHVLYLCSTDVTQLKKVRAGLSGGGTQREDWELSVYAR